jgi:hypothetical protein
MTVFSKHSYEEDDEHIMKAAGMQQHIMFSAPPFFLRRQVERRTQHEGGKKRKDETSDCFCSFKVPIDHKDKESKTYTVKVNRYDTGSPEEYLKWRLILAEQVKNNGDTDNPDNTMNLAHAMLVGRSLEAFLNEKRSQCWESNSGLRRSESRDRDKGNDPSGKNLCARGATA